MKISTFAAVAASTFVVGTLADPYTSYVTETFDNCPTTTSGTATVTDIITYCPVCEWAGFKSYPGGSFTTYPTVYPGLCPTDESKIEPQTYTVTEPCPSTGLDRSAGYIPQGFTTTTVPCGCEENTPVPITTPGPALASALAKAAPAPANAVPTPAGAPASGGSTPGAAPGSAPGSGGSGSPAGSSPGGAANPAAGGSGSPAGSAPGGAAAPAAGAPGSPAGASPGGAAAPAGGASESPAGSSPGGAAAPAGGAPGSAGEAPAGAAPYPVSPAPTEGRAGAAGTGSPASNASSAQPFTGVAAQLYSQSMIQVFTGFIAFLAALTFAL